jgi:endonuclease-3 related protein
MLQQWYAQLLKKHRPQGWWPTRKYGYNPANKTRKLDENEMLEICIGTILAQNTAWNNAEKALTALHTHDALSLKKLANLRREKLEKLIHSSGFFRQKAERLQLFARHVLEKHGSFSTMFKKKLEPLREELLSLTGIGPETADSMLLYAGRKPIFVVDKYTKSLCAKLGLCNEKISYDELQQLFHEKLPRDHRVFNEMHALIVAEGKVKD